MSERRLGLRMKRLLLALAFAGAASSVFAGKQPRVDLGAVVTPIYQVEGNAFVRHDGAGYSNRPLYCNHIYGAVLAGDKPYGILGEETNILGNLMFALIRGGTGRWLQDASDVTSKYRPGRMEWIVKDKAWGATVVHLEMAPAAAGPGLVAHVRVEQGQDGDTLVWASGAATIEKQSILWEYDMIRLPGKAGNPLMGRGFVPADCERNETAVNGASWTVQAGGSLPVTIGRCSADSKMWVGDADAWDDPVALLKKRGYARPLACGSVDLGANPDIYWSFLGMDAGTGKSPAEEFAAGMQRVEALENRVVVETPDPWLDAAVGASSIVEDACFRDGIYTHSGMRWSKALLAWRTLFGGTVYGSHANVKTEAAYCIGRQVTQSDKTVAVADPQMGLSRQSPESGSSARGEWMSTTHRITTCRRSSSTRSSTPGIGRGTPASRPCSGPHWTCTATI